MGRRASTWKGKLPAMASSKATTKAALFDAKPTLEALIADLTSDSPKEVAKYPLTSYFVKNAIKDRFKSGTKEERTVSPMFSPRFNLARLQIVFYSMSIRSLYAHETYL